MCFASVLHRLPAISHDSFENRKRVLTLSVEAPKVTPSLSVRCTVGIALSTSQCSETSLVVVGFVFSLPLNFSTCILATANSASTFVRLTKSERGCTIFTSKKLLFSG